MQFLIMQFHSTSCYFLIPSPLGPNIIPPTPHSVKTKNKLGGRRSERHITGPRNTENGGDVQKTEKNGGVI